MVGPLRYSERAIMATEVSRHLFTVHDYHRMVEAGILHEDDRVELIRGEILAMSPIGPPHNGSVLRANNLLMRIVNDRALVSAQGAVRLDQYSEPQPDIVLLRPRDDFYTHQHPQPADILLIVEIADSSLDFDRQIKAGLYAETGVVEYWVSDIPDRCIWTYADARGGTYQTVRQYGAGDVLVPRLLPECDIPLNILLP